MSKPAKNGKKNRKIPRQSVTLTEKKAFPYDLTIGMIIKDEAKTLRECLQSLQPLRDALKCQLIITDTGSTDGSIQIAKEFADVFLEFQWCNDFSAARNTGVKKAQGRWFLFLDADEIFDESILEIANFIQSSHSLGADHATIIQRNYYGDEFHEDKFDPLSTVRLLNFSKANRLFQSPIHESIPVNPSKSVTINTFVRHYGYLTQWAKKKSGRNEEILTASASTVEEKIRSNFYLAKSATDSNRKLTLALEAVEFTSHKQGSVDSFGTACYGFACDAYNKLERYHDSLSLKEKFFRQYGTDIPQALDVLHHASHAAMMSKDYPLTCSLLKEFIACHQHFSQDSLKDKALQGFCTTFTGELFIASCLLLAELSLLMQNMEDCHTYLTVSKGDEYTLPSGAKPYAANYQRLTQCLKETGYQPSQRPVETGVKRKNISPLSKDKKQYKYDLTIAMIVKNEEKNLRRCLESLQPLRDSANCQLIITDTGSTDGTIAIAKEFADVYLEFEWCSDFAAARNTGVERAEGRWFLFVDADQEFDQSILEIPAFLKKPASHKYDHAVVALRNYSGDVFHPDEFSDQKVGLLVNFGNGPRKFEMPIHERILLDRTNFYETNVLIHHYGYISDIYKEKVQRNQAILETTLEDEKLQFRSYFHIAKAASDRTEKLKVSLESISLAEQKGVMQNEYVASCYAIACSCLNEMKQYSKVLEFYTCYFKEFTTLIPQSLDIIHSAVYATLMLGKHDKSLTLLQEYISTYKKISASPMKVDAQNGLCSSYTDGDFITGCYQLAELYCAKGELDSAKKWLKESKGNVYKLPSGAMPYISAYKQVEEKIKNFDVSTLKSKEIPQEKEEINTMSHNTKKGKFPYELTISMIVKNEKKYLRRCLEALQPLRNAISCQLIITDTGSTDGTIEIAKEFADLYLEHPWNDNFSAARNVGVEKAEGRWFLFWDADEIALDSFVQIADFLKSPESHNYDNASIIMRSYLGDVNNYSHHHDKVSVKMFNFKDGQRFFKNFVHESIDFTSSTKVLPIIFDHFGYTDDIMEHKAEKYLNLLKKDLEVSPYSLRAHFQLVVAVDDFNEKLEWANKGIAIKPNVAAEPVFYPSLYLERTKALYYLKQFDKFKEALAMYLHEFPGTLIELEFLGIQLAAYRDEKKMAEFLEVFPAYFTLYHDLQVHPDVNHQSSARLELGSEENYLSFAHYGVVSAKKLGKTELAVKILSETQGYTYLSPRNIRLFYSDYYNFALDLKAYELIQKQYLYSVDQNLISDVENLNFSLEQHLKDCDTKEKERLAKEMGETVVNFQTALWNFRFAGYDLQKTDPKAKDYLSQVSDFANTPGSYDLLYSYFVSGQDSFGLLEKLSSRQLDQMVAQTLKFHKDFSFWTDKVLEKFTYQSLKEQKMWSQLGILLLGPLSQQDKKNPLISQENFFQLFTKTVVSIEEISNAIYQPVAFSPENMDVLPEEVAFCHMAFLALQQKDTDLAQYVAQLKQMLAQFPLHHKLISVLLEAAVSPSAPAASANEFSDIGAKVKGIIKNLLKSGDLQQAQGVLDQYKAINPSDPDIAVIEKTFEFLV